MPTPGMVEVVRWCCLPFLSLTTFYCCFSNRFFLLYSRNSQKGRSLSKQYKITKCESENKVALTTYEDFRSGEHLTTEIVNSPGKKLKTCRLNTAWSWIDLVYRPANISAIFVNIFAFDSRLWTYFRGLIATNFRCSRQKQVVIKRLSVSHGSWILR